MYYYFVVFESIVCFSVVCCSVNIFLGYVQLSWELKSCFVYGEAEGSGHIEQRVKDRRSINLGFSNDLREDTKV